MHPLEKFRTDNKLTYQGLALLIGVKNATTARNYCLGLSIPEPPVMRQVAVQTRFAVTADHFYGIDAKRRTVTDPVSDAA